MSMPYVVHKSMSCTLQRCCGIQRHAQLGKGAAYNQAGQHMHVQ